MRSFADHRPAAQALLAAALFAAGAPGAKLLLGQIEPVFLAGLLYMGSGIGLLLTMSALRTSGRRRHAEARLQASDVPRVIGATVTGGIAAPIALMVGLSHAPAATASLLLNFEAVATALIAGLVFREAIGRRVWISVACITAAGVILSVELNSTWGISLGALAVVVACVLWGVDNNITNTISAKDPLSIVTVKALGAGTFSIALAWAMRSPMPDLTVAAKAMIVGYFTYGLSIVLFIRAMRGIGAARAGALFGTAPFLGAALSFAIFRNSLDLRFLLALPPMIVGALLLLGERHAHAHAHFGLFHEHRHSHDDGHHNHEHKGNALSRTHSHSHTHDEVRHAHSHAPDIHHRHQHD